jgi:hypothetical protein
LAEDAVYMHQDMKDGNLCLAAEVTVYILVRMDLFTRITIYIRAILSLSWWT